MAGRLKKRFMLLLADTLYDWAAFLANRAEAGDEASLNPAEEEISSPGMEKPEEFRGSGQEVGNGGPPAHWLELVRQHAPELLDPEDFHSGETYGAGFPEYGMSETEGTSVDTSRSTNHVDLARANPQRPGNRPDDFRSPSASMASRSGSPDDSLHLSAEQNDRKTGIHEQSPGVQPSFLPTSGHPSRTNSARRDSPSAEPHTPPGPNQKQSLVQDDSLAFSMENLTETTGESGPYPQEQNRSASASPVATETAAGIPKSSSHKTGIKTRKTAEPDQGGTRLTTTAMNSIPETERLPAKSSFSIPGHKAISALRNYFFTDDDRQGKRREQKAPVTDKAAPPSGALLKPKQPAAVEPLRESDGHEPMNRVSANRPVNKASSRRVPEPSSPQEKPGFRATERDFSAGTESRPTPSGSSRFNPQSANQVFSEPPVWPSLPDEPEKKDFPVASQDLWPTLPENDSGSIHQLLTEARTIGVESAERIRRLEQEQRGLFWNG